MKRSIRPFALVVAATLLITGCSMSEPTGAQPPESTSTPGPAPGPAPGPTPGPTPGPLPVPDVGPDDGPQPVDADPTLTGGAAAPRPIWLGTRVLPLDADGFGQRLPTPHELIDRRLSPPPLPHPTPPPPPSDGSFRSTVADVTATIAARSTWNARCPVTLDELRYVTVTFIGFDERSHTGELLVHADVVDDIVDVFSALHAARFPIEELRIIAHDELDAPPTGDGNVTSAFVCRPTVGGTRWSDHAFGRAIDVNPFHNPYVRGGLIIPELAGAYVDRSSHRPGMIVAGDAATVAFVAAGWGWGGDWTGSATDPMHFSVSGR